MSNCGNKVILTLPFFALLTITYLFYIDTVDLRAHFAPLFQSQPSNLTPPCRSLSPLRVYMYDLPRRYNVGMLDRRSSDEAPVTAATLPPWPAAWGLRKQHSVEYWMMASLIYDVRGSEIEVVRVLDPEIADVFFVPFFSSTSFNVHTIKHDKELQVDILKFLEKSKYWQRSGGRDHVIPMQHPNAFKFQREQINASILIVADFSRPLKHISNLRKDVVAPYVHMVESYTNDDTSNPFESRTTLLFFRGMTVRKAEGTVRAKLVKILSGYDDVHYEHARFGQASNENVKLSTEGMRSSKFCLHPAGDTSTSCRLFDAIVSHCVPVIVSDHIELPFEDELDYSQFSIFYSTQEALKPGYMVEQLRLVTKERWVNMWKKLKNVSHHFEFQYPPRSGDAVNMLWRQVRHKVPVARLAIHRARRLKIPDWW